MANRSGVSCEIRIIRAENMETPKGGGCFFVRTYLSTGNNNGKVQLNTRELGVRVNEPLSWDESFCLDCNGTVDSVNQQLRRGSVVFELRWRPTTSSSFWGQLSSSKLIGRAELPWEPAFSSPESEIQAWVPLIRSKPSSFDLPSPGLLVAMTVKHHQVATTTVPRNSCEEEQCGCGNSCQDDYQLFAIAACLEAF